MNSETYQKIMAQMKELSESIQKKKDNQNTKENK